MLAVATAAVAFAGVTVAFTYMAPLLTRVAHFPPATVAGLLPGLLGTAIIAPLR